MPSAPTTSATPARHDIYVDDPAIQTVMREFETCVMVLVMCMSILNRPEPEKIVHFTMSNYRLPDVTRFPVMKPSLDEHGMPEEHIEALEDFHQAFDLAAPSLREITNDMPNGFDRGWMVDAGLSHFAAAKAALRFISCVPGLHQFCGAETSALAPAAELEAALRGVVKGEAPYWSSAGPTVPAWQMKRNAYRNTLNSPAKMSNGVSEEDVMITNISRLGFGIRPSPKIEIGAPVWIKLETGRTLNAVIKWKEHDRAGASFDVPLNLDDPLIAVS